MSWLERKWEVKNSEPRSARRTWKPLDKEVLIVIAAVTVVEGDVDTGDVVDLVVVAVGDTEEAGGLGKRRRAVRVLQLSKPAVHDGLFSSGNLLINAE